MSTYKKDSDSESTPSPKVKQDTFVHPLQLTPSEIESLRRKVRQASARLAKMKF